MQDKRTLFTFGYNQQGQLGHRNTENYNAPRQVTFEAEDAKENIRTIESVAAGRDHSLLLTGDGLVYGCGLAQNGELGLPLEEMQRHEETIDLVKLVEKGVLEFLQVYTLSKVKVAKIFAGGFHSFVILDKDDPKREAKPGVPPWQKYEIVYTDTELNHRFLRFTVPESVANYFKDELLAGLEM